MTHTTGKGPIDKWTARTVLVEIEFSDEEEAIIVHRAAQSGLTPEEYLRTRLGLEP